MTPTLLLLAASARGADVTIGSKPFSESRLLAEIMAQLIEARTDLSVERKANLGGTTVTFQALRTGEIDLYPEYTGTGWSVLLEIERPVSDSLEAYAAVSTLLARQDDLRWLMPFGFENSYAVGMREERAAELGISTISELFAQAAAVEVGFSHEFVSRDDGYPGLSARYGAALPRLRGVEHGLAYDAIATGEIDVTDSYTTDGKLSRYPIRILVDDRGFFPPYDAAPLARGDLFTRHPEVGPVLDLLAHRIDDDRMRALNARVEVDGQPFDVVAAEFLAAEGLTDAASTDAFGRRAQPLPDFIASRAAPTAALLVEHLALTGAAVLLSILIALPLGVAIARQRRLSFLLSGAGIIQTIPSLALLALMIPVPGLGLSARSAVLALTLYALLPIMRNTVTGISEIDADLIEAGRGMGMTERQLLVKVQLPLAAPTIMAGIRTATVISVGVATLAAFIGAGGLGGPIITGLQLNDTRLILAGAVPAALLAVAIDGLLGRVERAVTPRGLS